MATEIIDLPGAGLRGSFAEALGAMSPEERLAAYRRGAFTHRERTVWAANFPEEVPLVNDELEWIALSLADLD